MSRVACSALRMLMTSSEEGSWERLSSMTCWESFRGISMVSSARDGSSREEGSSKDGGWLETATSMVGI